MTSRNWRISLVVILPLIPHLFVAVVYYWVMDGFVGSSSYADEYALQAERISRGEVEFTRDQAVELYTTLAETELGMNESAQVMRLSVYFYIFVILGGIWLQIAMLRDLMSKENVSAEDT